MRENYFSNYLISHLRNLIPWKNPSTNALYMYPCRNHYRINIYIINQIKDQFLNSLHPNFKWLLHPELYRIVIFNVSVYVWKSKLRNQKLERSNIIRALLCGRPIVISPSVFLSVCHSEIACLGAYLLSRWPNLAQTSPVKCLWVKDVQSPWTMFLGLRIRSYQNYM